MVHEILYRYPSIVRSLDTKITLMPHYGCAASSDHIVGRLSTGIHTNPLSQLYRSECLSVCASDCRIPSPNLEACTILYCIVVALSLRHESFILRRIFAEFVLVLCYIMVGQAQVLPLDPEQLSITEYEYVHIFRVVFVDACSPLEGKTMKLRSAFTPPPHNFNI